LIHGSAEQINVTRINRMSAETLPNVHEEGVKPGNPPGPASLRGRLGKLPLGGLGAIALIIAFESFLTAHDSDFTNLNANDWRLTSRAVVPQSKKAELLCFGDSLLKFGLIPELLEQHTGLKTFNLSVLGGQSVGSFTLFRRAIESGAKPRAVVLDCQDLPIARGSNARAVGIALHERNLPELLDLRDVFELAISASDSSLFGTIMLRRWLPSLKSRYEIHKHFRKFARRGFTDSRYQAFVQKRNWNVNSGGLLLAPKTSEPTKLTASVAYSEWDLDPLTSEYLNRFFTLAEQHSIPVFWLIPPTSPEHETFRDKSGQHELITRITRDLQAKFAGMIVIDGRNAGYSREVFRDDTHLDRIGAVTFSTDIAKVIAQHLKHASRNSKWVNLPKYHSVSDVKAFEDMDSSRMAIDSPRSTRR
jgi:hypothetical protein